MSDTENVPQPAPTQMVQMTTSVPDYLAQRVYADMAEGERNQSGQVRYIIKRYYDMIDAEMMTVPAHEPAYEAARAAFTPFADRYPDGTADATTVIPGPNDTAWMPAAVPPVVRDNRG